MVGILLVLAPRIVGEDDVGLQQPEQEDESRAQLGPRDVVHHVVVVVEIERLGHAEHAADGIAVACIGHDRFGIRPGSGHVVIGDANQVPVAPSSISFGAGAGRNSGMSSTSGLDAHDDLSGSGFAGAGPSIVSGSCASKGCPAVAMWPSSARARRPARLQPEPPGGRRVAGWTALQSGRSWMPRSDTLCLATRKSKIVAPMRTGTRAPMNGTARCGAMNAAPLRGWAAAGDALLGWLCVQASGSSQPSAPVRPGEAPGWEAD